MGHKTEFNYLRDEETWHLFRVNKFSSGLTASIIYSLENCVDLDRYSRGKRISDFGYISSSFFRTLPEKELSREDLFKEARKKGFNDISGYAIYFSGENEENELSFIGPILERKVFQENLGE